MKELSEKNSEGGLAQIIPSDVPESVKNTIRLLEVYGIKHILSRNSPATSCRDAAARRNRLGTMGIPLGDELKSACVVLYDERGDRHYVLLHCRANQRFDMVHVEKLLGASRPIARLAAQELADVLGSQYGTVNPFIDTDKIHAQIFDAGVLEEHAPPYTMMTNAGKDTWAVEFYPKELVEKMSKAFPGKFRVEDIASRVKTQSNRRFVLGLITGNGPESGMALWTHVNHFVREDLGSLFNGDLSYPPVIVHSIPEMGLSMELEYREDVVWAHLREGIVKLCESGATHVALACHTTHFFTERIRELCRMHKAEFVSIVDVAAEYIASQGIHDITIIGIPYVSDLGEWSAYKALSSVRMRQAEEKTRQTLLELGYWVKKTGSDIRGLNKLTHVMRAGVSTEYVLIALTEISVLLAGFPKKQSTIGDRKIIDPLMLYGKKLAELYIKSRAGLSEGDLAAENDGLIVGEMELT